MKKHTKNIRPRALELKTETVIQLTRDRLTQVVGGEGNSMHPSQCVVDRCA